MRIFIASFLTLAAGALSILVLTPPQNPLKDMHLHVEARSTGFEVLDTTPQTIWLNGSAEDAAKVHTVIEQSTASSTVPAFVLYNIPKRDCDSYSAGGAETGMAYRQWIASIANSITNKQAIIILEPDALSAIDCLSPEEQTERIELIKHAVNILSQNKNAFIYIDAGNVGWKNPKEIARRLTEVGIDRVQGFSLNVSNFYHTDETAQYGRKISYQLKGKKTFVIDTSRNGNGPAENNEWCNPPERALGDSPTTTLDIAFVDALLWIKIPGESDGECNGGPKAGTFWPEYAQTLVENSTR